MSGSGAQTFRLSPRQRAIWSVVGSSDGEAEPYVATLALDLVGELDGEAVRSAVAAAVARHDLLRARFVREAGLSVPLQEISPRAEAQWAEGGAAASEAPTGPLKAGLHRLGDRLHRLTLSLPSLCADRESMLVLARQIVRDLSDRDASASSADEDVLQYPDYAEWRNELAAEAGPPADAAEAETVWSLADLLPAGEVSAGLSPQGGFSPQSVAAERASSVEFGEAARAMGVRPGTFYLAAWGLALGRAVGRLDPRVGVALPNRGFEEMEEAVGPFAVYRPLGVELRPGFRFSELAHALDAAWRAAEEAEESGEAAGEPAPPCEALFSAFTDERQWKAGELTVRLPRAKAVAKPFLVHLACWQDGADGEVETELHFDGSRLGSAEAEQLLARYQHVLAEALRSPDRPLSQLDGLLAAERQSLRLAPAEAADRPERPLVESFLDTVRREPARRALVTAERAWTYGELAEGAGDLAHRLRAAGAGPERFVALDVDRHEAVPALLGVLLSGAAYVPLEPGYPAARRRRLVEESRARIAVTGAESDLDLPAGIAGVPVTVEGAKAKAPDLPRPLADHLAYELFTSGSTGPPKPVGVEHRSLALYARSLFDRLELSEGWSYATLTTFAADLGLSSVLPALTSGGCLHVPAAEVAGDPVALAAWLHRHPVDSLKAVPSHLEALLTVEEGADVLPRRLLILGGELARWSLLDRIAELRPDLEVVNHYGPTEATVGVSVYRPRPEDHGLEDHRAEAAGLPIGSALAGRTLTVLGEGLHPVPAGVEGELAIGGGGLARGYLGRPGATAERFLPDAWSLQPGARIYRTGDRVRRTDDGELIFLGRTDHQVKIRGHRVEPGEVEQHLHAHPQVRDAAVVVRTDPPAGARLVAYAVPRPGESPAAEELRGFLAQELPEPALPADTVFLEALPLTANGKLDPTALPAPGATAEARVTVPPRNAVERALCSIWSEVLGRDEIGILDNFFELGGDSILAIQVIARASREGLRLTPNQFFEHQTVSELALVTESATAPAVVRSGAATVPLLPIQRWFFEQDLPDPSHWNQAVLVEASEELSAGALRAALVRLAELHEALRFRFEPVGRGWRQVRHGATAPSLAEIDLSALAEDRMGGAIERAAGAVHRSFDLATGPLLAAALMRAPAGHADRVLLVGHHLVVDTVSWRIILNELVRVHDAIVAGRPGEDGLSEEATPFGTWAERLHELAAGDELDSDAALWLDLAPRIPEPLPHDPPPPSERVVSCELDEETTAALLGDAMSAYRTHIDELLLAALALAVHETWGRTAVWVELEGHGREDLFEGVDLSRTVGWFTTHYPALLEIGDGGELGATVRSIKETLRRIPRRGLGFSLLRYFAPDESVRSGLAELPRPQIGFNYLGQVDRQIADSGRFAPAPESTGRARSASASRRVEIDVAARVLGGRLRVAWRYSIALHRRETVERLATAFADSLRAVVEHCLSVEDGGFTASDFPLAGASDEQLRRIASRVKSAAGGSEG